MKITLHKVLQGPFLHPEYPIGKTEEVHYCVVYLSDVDGHMEETEMLYQTFNEAYEESNIVSSTIEGVTIGDDVYDA
jgi:hypothetical protein|tara:strand:- start:1042 stop:1272 length:231 start_codon:yes stop_codon:yes gene_type:complete